ncbi:MAG: hypothetical protein ACOX31_02280 [Eubacteriales bacterium]|jgi:hypothetical protein
MGKDFKSINFIPPCPDKKPPENEPEKSKKTATNNQWVSTGLRYESDDRERRDGPGGEDGNPENEENRKD